MQLTWPKIKDFMVLVLRWYLAYYMFHYGWSKLSGGQFGLHNPEILVKPLKDVSKFQLAWYLFGLSKAFNIGVGVMQIMGAILIVINRTVLVGALILLPILFQIFLVDVSFTMETFGAAMVLRLGFMILSDVLILLYYKENINKALINLTTGLKYRFKYPWWLYLLLPIIGLGMDFVFAILGFPLKLLLNWLLVI